MDTATTVVTIPTIVPALNATPPAITTSNAINVNQSNSNSNTHASSSSSGASISSSGRSTASSSNVNSNNISSNSNSSSSSTSSNSSGYGSTTTTPINNYETQRQQQTPTPSRTPTTPVAAAEPIIPIATVAAVTPFYNEAITTHNLEIQHQQQQQQHQQQQQQQQHQLQQNLQHHQYLQLQQYYSPYDYQQQTPPNLSSSSSAAAYNMGSGIPYDISSTIASAAGSYVGGQYKSSGLSAINYERNSAGRTAASASSYPHALQSEQHSKKHQSTQPQFAKQRSSSLITASNTNTSKPQAAATPFYAQPLSQHSSSGTFYDNLKHRMPLDYHDNYSNPTSATYHQQQKYYAEAKSQLKEASYGSPAIGSKLLYPNSTNYYAGSAGGSHGLTSAAYDKYMYPHSAATAYSTTGILDNETPTDASYRKSAVANSLNSPSWPWGIDYASGNSRTIPQTASHLPTATVAPTHAAFLTPNPSAFARDPYYMTTDKYNVKYDKYSASTCPPPYQQSYVSPPAARHHMWPSSHAPQLTQLNDRQQHLTTGPSAPPPHALHSTPYYPANAAAALNARQSCCSQTYQPPSCFYPPPTRLSHSQAAPPVAQTAAYMSAQQPLAQSGHLNALSSSCKYGGVMPEYGNANKLKNPNDLYMTSHYDTHNAAHNFGYGGSNQIYNPNAHQALNHGPSQNSILTHEPLAVNPASYSNDLNLTTNSFDNYSVPHHRHHESHITPASLGTLHSQQQHSQYAPTVTKRALLDYRKPIQPQPPPLGQEECYNTLTPASKEHFNHQELLHTPETPSAFVEYQANQEVASLSYNPTPEAMQETDKATEEANKNLSLRDFIANWNDDEEEYANNEELSFDQTTAVINEVLQAAPTEQEAALDTELEQPLSQENLKSQSLKDAPKPTESFIEDSLNDADPNQYVNLPDIIIDIEKSNNVNSSITTPLTTPTPTTEDLNDNTTSLILNNFDVEQELDQLKMKKEGEKLDIKDNCITTPQLSPCKGITTQLSFEDLNLEQPNNKTVLTAITARPVTNQNSTTDTPTEQYFKDIDDYDSGNSRHSNESAFEKEYETFINKITSESSTKSNSVKTCPETELDFEQNVQDFSKFYKRKRKLKEDELKSLSANKKKLKSNSVEIANHSNFPQVYTKKSRNRHLKDKQSPHKRKPLSVYYKIIHSLRRYRLYRINRVRAYIAELKEKHLPLIKRQSIKNYSHAVVENVFNSKSLKNLCIMAINTEEFRFRIMLPIEDLTQNSLESEDKHLCTDPTCETCEVIKSLMEPEETFENTILNPEVEGVFEIPGNSVITSPLLHGLIPEDVEHIVVANAVQAKHLLSPNSNESYLNNFEAYATDNTENKINFLHGENSAPLLHVIIPENAEALETPNESSLNSPQKQLGLSENSGNDNNDKTFNVSSLTLSVEQEPENVTSPLLRGLISEDGERIAVANAVQAKHLLSPNSNKSCLNNFEAYDTENTENRIKFLDGENSAQLLHVLIPENAEDPETTNESSLNSPQKQLDLSENSSNDNNDKTLYVNSLTISVEQEAEKVLDVHNSSESIQNMDNFGNETQTDLEKTPEKLVLKIQPDEPKIVINSDERLNLGELLPDDMENSFANIKDYSIFKPNCAEEPEAEIEKDSNQISISPILEMSLPESKCCETNILSKIEKDSKQISKLADLFKSGVLEDKQSLSNYQKLENKDSETIQGIEDKNLFQKSSESLKSCNEVVTSNLKKDFTDSDINTDNNISDDEDSQFSDDSESEISENDELCNKTQNIENKELKLQEDSKPESKEAFNISSRIENLEFKTSCQITSEPKAIESKNDPKTYTSDEKNIIKSNNDLNANNKDFETKTIFSNSTNSVPNLDDDTEEDSDSSESDSESSSDSDDASIEDNMEESQNIYTDRENYSENETEDETVLNKTSETLKQNHEETGPVESMKSLSPEYVANKNVVETTKEPENFKYLDPIKYSENSLPPPIELDNDSDSSESESETEDETVLNKISETFKQNHEETGPVESMKSLSPEYVANKNVVETTKEPENFKYLDPIKYSENSLPPPIELDNDSDSDSSESQTEDETILNKISETLKQNHEETGPVESMKSLSPEYLANTNVVEMTKEPENIKYFDSIKYSGNSVPPPIELDNDSDSESEEENTEKILYNKLQQTSSESLFKFAKENSKPFDSNKDFKNNLQKSEELINDSDSEWDDESEDENISKNEKPVIENVVKLIEDKNDLVSHETAKESENRVNKLSEPKMRIAHKVRVTEVKNNLTSQIVDEESKMIETDTDSSSDFESDTEDDDIDMAGNKIWKDVDDSSQVLRASQTLLLNSLEFLETTENSMYASNISQTSQKMPLDFLKSSKDSDESKTCNSIVISNNESMETAEELKPKDICNLHVHKKYINVSPEETSNNFMKSSKDQEELKTDSIVISDDEYIDVPKQFICNKHANKVDIQKSFEEFSEKFKNKSQQNPKIIGPVESHQDLSSESRVENKIHKLFENSNEAANKSKDVIDVSKQVIGTQNFKLSSLSEKLADNEDESKEFLENTESENEVVTDKLDENVGVNLEFSENNDSENNTVIYHDSSLPNEVKGLKQNQNFTKLVVSSNANAKEIQELSREELINDESSFSSTIENLKKPERKEIATEYLSCLPFDTVLDLSLSGVSKSFVNASISEDTEYTADKYASEVINSQQSKKLPDNTNCSNESKTDDSNTETIDSHYDKELMSESYQEKNIQKNKDEHISKYSSENSKDEKTNKEFERLNDSLMEQTESKKLTAKCSEDHENHSQCSASIPCSPDDISRDMEAFESIETNSVIPNTTSICFQDNQNRIEHLELGNNTDDEVTAMDTSKTPNKIAEKSENTIAEEKQYSFTSKFEEDKEMSGKANKAITYSPKSPDDISRGMESFENIETNSVIPNTTSICFQDYQNRIEHLEAGNNTDDVVTAMDTSKTPNKIPEKSEDTIAEEKQYSFTSKFEEDKEMSAKSNEAITYSPKSPDDISSGMESFENIETNSVIPNTTLICFQDYQNRIEHLEAGNNTDDVVTAMETSKTANKITEKSEDIIAEEKQYSFTSKFEEDKEISAKSNEAITYSPKSPDDISRGMECFENIETDSVIPNTTSICFQDYQNHIEHLEAGNNTDDVVTAMETSKTANKIAEKSEDTIAEVKQYPFTSKFEEDKEMTLKTNEAIMYSPDSSENEDKAMKTIQNSATNMVISKPNAECSLDFQKNNVIESNEITEKSQYCVEPTENVDNNSVFAYMHYDNDLNISSESSLVESGNMENTKSTTTFMKFPQTTESNSCLKETNAAHLRTLSPVNCSYETEIIDKIKISEECVPKNIETTENRVLLTNVEESNTKCSISELTVENFEINKNISKPAKKEFQLNEYSDKTDILEECELYNDVSKCSVNESQLPGTILQPTAGGPMLVEDKSNIFEVAVLKNTETDNEFMLSDTISEPTNDSELNDIPSKSIENSELNDAISESAVDEAKLHATISESEVKDCNDKSDIFEEDVLKNVTKTDDQISETPTKQPKLNDNILEPLNEFKRNEDPELIDVTLEPIYHEPKIHETISESTIKETEVNKSNENLDILEEVVLTNNNTTENPISEAINEVSEPNDSISTSQPIEEDLKLEHKINESEIVTETVINYQVPKTLVNESKQNDTILESTEHRISETVQKEDGISKTLVKESDLNDTISVSTTEYQISEILIKECELDDDISETLPNKSNLNETLSESTIDDRLSETLTKDCKLEYEISETLVKEFDVNNTVSESTTDDRITEILVKERQLEDGNSETPTMAPDLTTTILESTTAEQISKTLTKESEHVVNKSELQVPISELTETISESTIEKPDSNEDNSKHELILKQTDPEETKSDNLKQDFAVTQAETTIDEKITTEELSGDFFGYNNQSSFEDESGDFHGFEDIEEERRIRREIENLNEDSSANDGFLHSTLNKESSHVSSTNSLTGSTTSEINELEALEKELSQHQVDEKNLEDDKKETDTNLVTETNNIMSTNDIEHIKKMLESDEEQQQDDNERHATKMITSSDGTQQCESITKTTTPSEFNEHIYINNFVECYRDISKDSVIPKLSELCRAALNSSLHANSFKIVQNEQTDNDDTPTILVERELTVEEALAEMYRQAGALLSDPEDCDNDTHCNEQAQDVLLINLQEILNSDNDVYLLHCGVNNENEETPEENTERVNTLQFIGILNTENSEPQIHIISSDSESEVIILSDDCESDFEPSIPEARHERIIIPFINDDEFNNDSLSDISTIHHEEIVPENLNKFLQEEFYKYLHEKYVQRNISKYYYANRVLKKYKKRFIKKSRQ